MLLAFLAFVVLLAGFVAYSADNIARRVGRKHMRLFGLRPKTTALLVAVAAGMGISLLSMLAFFTLNRQAIRNITQADVLRKEYGQLQKDVGAARQQLGQVTAQRDQANQRAAEAAARTAQARDRAAAAERELGAANLGLKQAQQATLVLENRAGELKNRVTALTQLRDRLRTQAAANAAALAGSRAALISAQQQVGSLDARLAQVQQQITALDERNARATQEAEAASRRAAELGQQIAALETSRQAVVAQRDAAAAQRDAATSQRNAATSQRAAALAQRDAAVAQRQAAATERDSVAAQRDRITVQLRDITAQRDRIAAQRQDAVMARDQAVRERTVAQAARDDLLADRDKVRREVAGLQQTVIGLRAQSLALQSDNAALRDSLSSSQASVSKLEDEYSRVVGELSVSRSAELSYPKNAIVYGAVVPTVRNLDSFLKQAAAAASQRGARPASSSGFSVRLAAPARQALENTLRGYNVGTFVLCRASGNSVAGAPVDLTCEARPNSVLYARGAVIRQTQVDLSGSEETQRSAVQSLINSAILDLNRRGVPVEYVQNGGLDEADVYVLLKSMAGKGQRLAVVGIKSRTDIKPGSQVALYADILP